MSYQWIQVFFVRQDFSSRNMSIFALVYYFVSRRSIALSNRNCFCIHQWGGGACKICFFYRIDLGESSVVSIVMSSWEIWWESCKWLLPRFLSIHNQEKDRAEVIPEGKVYRKGKTLETYIVFFLTRYVPYVIDWRDQ